MAKQTKTVRMCNPCTGPENARFGADISGSNQIGVQILRMLLALERDLRKIASVTERSRDHC